MIGKRQTSPCSVDRPWTCLTRVHTRTAASVTAGWDLFLRVVALGSSRREATLCWLSLTKKKLKRFKRETRKGVIKLPNLAC